LLERLYPYLARSPSSQKAMARGFFGRDLSSFEKPGFSHGPRWRSAAALKRLFSAEVRERAANTDVTARLLADLPAALPTWSKLAQDQYLEVRTLLPGYILSSQGDRMLMANSIEGRFPFLDKDVMELANSLPHRMKLRVLDEKHVLKAASRDLLPAEVLERKKQPYRAPDAVCFAAEGAPAWVKDVLSETSLKDSRVFEPKAVSQLYEKCRAAAGTLSNADNMALVAVLSTELLHATTKKPAPDATGLELTTLVDRIVK
jgi:asparagine synthase (glutamine-hydrolysing)